MTIRITKETAASIEALTDAWSGKLLVVNPEIAHRKPSDDQWSISQVIGHLVDSACNNHQRFVRAQFVDQLTFPKYEQNQWASAANYRGCDWSLLVTLWHN